MNPCRARRHDTVHAYKNCHCRCPAAREAYRLYTKRWREHRLPVALHDPTGTRNRLRALQAIGHTHASIAAYLTQAGHPTTRTALMRLAWSLTRGRQVTTGIRNRITQTYDALCMTPGPSRAAATLAHLYGYQPPAYWLEWGGIDDPDHTPAPDHVVDEVAIARVLHHKAKLDILHPHEQLHLYNTLRAQGLDDGQIRYRLNLSAATTARLARAAAATETAAA